MINPEWESQNIDICKDAKKTFTDSISVINIGFGALEGKIKEVKDMSHLSEYILSTSPNLRGGETVQDFTFLSEDYAPKVGLKIPGKNKTDMQNTYRSINALVQECIIYED